MFKVLAFDYGANSGRAVLGKFDGETVQLEEAHRFPNDPVYVNGSLFCGQFAKYKHSSFSSEIYAILCLLFRGT